MNAYVSRGRDSVVYLQAVQARENTAWVRPRFLCIYNIQNPGLSLIGSVSWWQGSENLATLFFCIEYTSVYTQITKILIDKTFVIYAHY